MQWKQKDKEINLKLESVGKNLMKKRTIEAFSFLNITYRRWNYRIISVIVAPRVSIQENLNIFLLSGKESKLTTKDVIFKT